MAKARAKSRDTGRSPVARTQHLDVVRSEPKLDGHALARVTLDPVVRHASLAGTFGGQCFGDKRQAPLEAICDVLGKTMDKAADGDKTMASRMLAAQAVSL